MACSFITSGLTATCAALKKRGGANKRVWIGALDDIASVTKDGTSHKLTAVTMESGKKLYSWSGKPYKNAGRYELVAGENVNIVKHFVDLEIFHETQLDRDAIDELIDAEDLVVFMQNNAGQIEVYGLDIEAGPPTEPEGGLKMESGTGGTGKVLNDNTAFVCTLSGDVSHLPYIFESTDLATSIAALDALL